jgi:hypothetical protein
MAEMAMLPDGRLGQLSTAVACTCKAGNSATATVTVESQPAALVSWKLRTSPAVSVFPL